jgi:hypothetical protein
VMTNVFAWVLGLGPVKGCVEARVARQRLPRATLGLLGSALLVALAGCNERQTSSSSHWITCAQVIDCYGVPTAVDCLDGYCTDATGERVSAGDPDLPANLPDALEPVGGCAVPAEAEAADSSTPDQVVGDGTPVGCTSEALVAAVARGGVITFDCGPDPVTIVLEDTVRIFNDANPDVVIDGGGLVTLSGAGARRILYMNTCDPDLTWTTDHCDDQDHPRLTVQNLTFFAGNSAGEDSEGGGAIWARGGRLKIVNCSFYANRCDSVGPDVAGGAVYVLDQFEDQPVYVVGSTFGGAMGLGNSCSNGGGIGTIGVSYAVLNSTFSHNTATGRGAEPPQAGTPGGGNGGAIYNDGNTYTLTVCGTRIESNHANEGGGAIFYVSNDLSGSLVIQDSVLTGNPSDGFETDDYPGIFVQTSGDPQVTNSTIE